ncbi:MAG: NADH-quinone oxidoreductase subunit C [Myxococcota bacterium]
MSEPTEPDLQQRAEDLVRERFHDQVVAVGVHAGQRWIEVRRDKIVEILKTLRDQLKFEMLMDLTAVDWLNQGRLERFTVVYELFSLTHNGYYRVKAWVPEHEPEIDSAFEVWKAAPWAEREVFDMYGLHFRNHPELADGRMRRILLPDAYPGHPLRKDYPLEGFGERYDFEVHRRG